MVFYKLKITKNNYRLFYKGFLIRKMSLILLFGALFFILGGCIKEEVVPPPIVEIISPSENELIYLPGELHLHLRLKSSNSIKFIQVSIKNYAQVAVFEPKQYFPDEQTVEINEYLNFSLLPQGQHPPYYLHLRVIDASGTNNFFREINLSNPDLKYLGFYLATRPSVNKTEVFFYDEDLNETSFVTVDGELDETEVSTYQDMFYLTTRNPGTLKAYHFEDQELVWEVLPDLPNPEFTGLHFRDNYLFAGTANGRIKSFFATSGNPGVIAKRLSDSVPQSVSTSNGYIIGDYLSKKQNGNALAVFYRTTGIIFQKKPLNFDVVDIYFEKYGFGFLVFGNSGDKGIQILYQPLNNSFGESFEFAEGLIQRTIQFNQDKFFLNIDQKVFLFNSIDQSNKFLLSFNEDIVDFVFDDITSNLFIAFSDRVEIYSYPDMQKIASQKAPYPVKSIELRRAY